jgi:DNA repair photolyase
MTLIRVSNPPNRFSTEVLEGLDEPPEAGLEVYEEWAKSILSKNDSPDIPFRYSVNPYRGCFHSCAYCYARPTHQYIDLGAGTDFDRKIVAKVNAATLLEEAFQKRSWAGDVITFSGVTDCYQPLEASYELTRKCLAICARYRNPISIITKGALVRRDIDILTRLSQEAAATVFFSIAFSEDEMSRKIEPFAPRPSVRFRAMRELADAGIPVGIGVAPVIPGLNESQIPKILAEAKRCGASFAFMTLLRLPGVVEEVFQERLNAAYPLKAKKVFSQLRQLKGGVTNRSIFGERMSGSGEHWKVIEHLFNTTCNKLNFGSERQAAVQLKRKTFQRPSSQLLLFP